jgi:hypothetical protein
VGISFEHPAWLWALLAIAPLCLVALTGFGSMSRWRRSTAALARAALTVLIVAMLAGAQSVRETERLAVVGVVDLSGSVRRFGGFAPGEDAGSFARRFFADRLENRDADDLFGLVVFDGRSVTIATPSRATVLDRSLALLPIEGSDLAGALRHAAALVPPDAAGRLVLVSDGNATGADPVEAAARLGAGPVETGAGGRPSIPVDVLPIGYRVDDEVIVERLDAPPRAPSGSTVPLRVQLRSTGSSSGVLRLLREGEPVPVDEAGRFGRRVELSPGRRVEVLEVPLEAGRLSRFEVVYEPDPVGAGGGGLSGDRSLENNRAEAFTISPGESRALLVDGVSGGVPDAAGSVLARTLRRDGLGVEVVAPSGVPSDLLGWQAFDLVILQNVSAEAMPAGSMERLDAFVRELGGGLVVVGGPETLGAGGWRGSALEPILPVKLDLPEKLVTPEAAIVIVLDNSGSMRRGVLGSSRTQQEVANEAAARAIESLDPGDLVGRDRVQQRPGRGDGAGAGDGHGPDRGGDAPDRLGGGDQPAPGARDRARPAARGRGEAQAHRRAERRAEPGGRAARGAGAVDPRRGHPHLVDRGGRRGGPADARGGGDPGRRRVLPRAQPERAAQRVPQGGARRAQPAGPRAALRARAAGHRLAPDRGPGRAAPPGRAGADPGAGGAHDHLRDGDALGRAGARALGGRAGAGRGVHQRRAPVGGAVARLGRLPRACGPASSVC